MKWKPLLSTFLYFPYIENEENKKYLNEQTVLITFFSNYNGVNELIDRGTSVCLASQLRVL